MRLISSIVLFAFAATAAAGSRDHATFARLMMWTPGERIDWRACSDRLWGLESTFVRHPRGDEADPPESVLELTVTDKTSGRRSVYEVTVAQALRRGYSLEGLRFRLGDKGWESILALKVEGGRLTDFVLMPTCDLPLVARTRE